MCGFCERHEKLEMVFSNTKGGLIPIGTLVGMAFTNDAINANVEIDAENGFLGYDNSDGEYRMQYIKINYCPICGRKLNEEESND